MSFLESFARNIGNLRKGVYAPLMEHQNQLELQQQQLLVNQQMMRQQAAIDVLAKLEQQRKQAEHVQENPVPEGHDTVDPQFGFADKMKMQQAYKLSGIDPADVADSDIARLRAKAFEEAMGGITNPYALANMANKQDVSPHRQVGQSIYNRFTGTHGLTDQGQAQAREAKSKADEQAWRLAKMQGLLPEDRLMALNFLNNKELGKPTEAEVEGPDGKTHKAMISQTPTGTYHYSTVTGAEGEPLVIPPEAVGGDMTTDQKNVKYYSKLWGKTEAETATILKTRTSYSDAGAWESLYQKNTEGSFGRRNDDVDILTNTFKDFRNTRYGSPVPIDFQTLIASSDMTDKEKETLLAEVTRYNDDIAQQTAVANTPTGNVPPAVTPSMPTPTAAPGVNKALLQAMQQPPPDSANIPLSTQPATPSPMTKLAPVPESPPPQPMDFDLFAQTVMTHNSPGEINAALKKQGMNMTPEAVGLMAIDAVNQGVPAKDIQQLFQILGIDWKPPT